MAKFINADDFLKDFENEHKIIRHLLFEQLTAGDNEEEIRNLTALSKAYRMTEAKIIEFSEAADDNTAHWEYDGTTHYCSRCGADDYYAYVNGRMCDNFCPNCGADMR